MKHPFSLQGKTILVTGASSGIGRSVAIECSKMGAKLIVTARNKERLFETINCLDNNVEHQIIQADLSNEIELQRMLQELPSLDGAVLCAGKGLTLPVQFSTREKFDEIFNINFFAPVELFRMLVKKKKLLKDSSVVFISSIGGPSVISNGNGIYGASKSALSTMMKFCALEYSAKNIRVNAICPGMVDTPLIRQSNLTEEQISDNAQLYPLKRLGRPEDIAYGSIYLLSEASSWITGVNLVIDGGITLK